jgi:putative acetyltransferase
VISSKDPPSGLSIRPLAASDAEAMTALVNLPGFRSGTLRMPYQSPEQTRKWLENRGPDSLHIVAVLDGAIVGSAGLDRYRGRRVHAAGIGMGIHDEHQGRGIGAALLRELVDAADNWLGIKRLELTVFADNVPAIRLYEKFGFEREGVMRAFAFRAGSYHDAIGMARIR